MHPAARTSDAHLIRGRLALGDFELTRCSGGTYLLDGAKAIVALNDKSKPVAMPVESKL